jgi:hypothetical protein
MSFMILVLRMIPLPEIIVTLAQFLRLKSSRTSVSDILSSMY